MHSSTHPQGYIRVWWSSWTHPLLRKSLTHLLLGSWWWIMQKALEKYYDYISPASQPLFQILGSNWMSQDACHRGVGKVQEGFIIIPPPCQFSALQLEHMLPLNPPLRPGAPLFLGHGVRVQLTPRLLTIFWWPTLLWMVVCRLTLL